MIKKEKLVMLVVMIILVIVGLYFLRAFLPDKERGFDVDNILLKLLMKEGESVSETLTITNTGSEKIDFEINVKGLELVSVNEEEFSLDSGDAKSLTFDFNVKNKSAGVYLGEILILSNGNVLIIPVILEIETKEILFDSTINLDSDSSNVYAGERAIIETKIFNLGNIGLKIVEVSYVIQDFDENVIFSDLVLEDVIGVPIPIKKIVQIPDVGKGNYVLTTIVKYGDSVGTSSHFFEIIGKKPFYKRENDFFMWMVILFIFGLIFFIIYYMKRDDLRKQYRRALKKENWIQKLEKKRIMKLKPVKRKIVLKEFRKKTKKRLKAIRRIHKKRVKVFRKLKKKKRKSEMQRKLSEWKKQGYNINEFLVKTGKKKEVLKNRVGKLEKEGYKV